jgi:hypothetical protein
MTQTGVSNLQAVAKFNNRIDDAFGKRLWRNSLLISYPCALYPIPDTGSR